MRQISLYAHPTARISTLIIAMSQKLLRPATRNPSPSTYNRLVPQSPKSKPAALNQPTLRGRSLASSDSAAGFSISACWVAVSKAKGTCFSNFPVRGQASDGDD